MIIFDNRKISAHWLDHEEASKYFLEQKLHDHKIMVTVWWSAIDITRYSLLESNQSIITEFYYQQLDEIRIHLSKVR